METTEQIIYRIQQENLKRCETEALKNQPKTT